MNLRRKPPQSKISVLTNQVTERLPVLRVSDVIGGVASFILVAYLFRRSFKSLFGSRGLKSQQARKWNTVNEPVTEQRVVRTNEQVTETAERTSPTTLAEERTGRPSAQFGAREAEDNE